MSVDSVLTIHVLGFGELFELTVNAMAVFVKNNDLFDSLLKLTSLIGIILVSVGYLKRRDPMIYAKWILAYVLVIQVIITPKTNVQIYDISAQKAYNVDNVPLLFAATASVITTIGVGLAEWYDEQFSLGDLAYTKTGSLFGSKLIQAARDFRIVNPALKEEMNGFLRNCVVGDIRLSRKYSMEDLGKSNNIWDLISKTPSPVRMTEVNGKVISCKEAVSSEKGANSLKLKMDKEIENAYTFFGVNLFGKPDATNEEKLFQTRLKSAADYYQFMTDESANIMLQSMMINAIGDGIKDYQAFTDSTAGIVNNQVTKSQIQHRWSWAIAGQKAAWFLPILHTLLTVLLFGIFPIIIVMTTLPAGINIFRGYVQFFISLQFWPVLFSILNAAMTLYASNKSAQFGGLSLVNIDKIDEFHGDLSGVAGYLMLFIPFIAKGLVSNLSDAFNNLATSMGSHLQGSAMSVANDAANASFSLGQTSFHNTSANNFSANKHDSNWTNMHGMHTEQLDSGVLKSTSSSGAAIFDVGPGMTKSFVSINQGEALSQSLNHSLEQSNQSVAHESQQYQSSLSGVSHAATQLSKLDSHDWRLGEGVSSSESSQYSEALSTMTHIASDVGKRMHVSTEDAMSTLVGNGLHGHAGISSDKSALGSLAKIAVGAQGGVDLSTRVDKSSNSSDRFQQSDDVGISAREAEDFNNAFNHVKQFTQSHHFDENASKAQQYSKQLGSDLRNSETASHNMEASLSKASRISHAKQYVESHSAQINSDLSQAFSGFVSEKVGEVGRDNLFGHPGDMKAVSMLNQLGDDFIAVKREELIANQGSRDESYIDNQYRENQRNIQDKESSIVSNFSHNQENLEKTVSTDFTKVEKTTQKFKADTQNNIETLAKQTLERGQDVEKYHDNIKKNVTEEGVIIEKNAKRSTLNPIRQQVPNTNPYTKLKESVDE